MDTDGVGNWDSSGDINVPLIGYCWDSNGDINVPLIWILMG